MTAPTAMAAEIAETPAAVARGLDNEAAALRHLGARLRALSPPLVAVCGRGSSHHAAQYFAYVLEILAGVPVASLGPSIASIYQAPMRLRGCVLVCVSQSGQSPDLVALQSAARSGGALAIAVVNDAASPLAGQADVVLPLHAGAETSVAATKTCATSAALLAGLIAEWTDNTGLRHAVQALPEALRQAQAADWSAMLPTFAKAASAYVIGRGPALPVAMETALKLKETCMLHAEAFSGAEVMHGPLQLLRDGFPVLAFRPPDAAHAAIGETIAHLAAVGGCVFTCEPGRPGGKRLAFTATSHPLLDPLTMLLSSYRFTEALARARGHDPDRPSLLRKVTETL